MNNRKERYNRRERAWRKMEGAHVGAEERRLRDELACAGNLDCGDIHPSDAKALRAVLGPPECHSHSLDQGWRSPGCTNGIEGRQPHEIPTISAHGVAAVGPRNLYHSYWRTKVLGSP